jgi:hypothetical protein
MQEDEIIAFSPRKINGDKNYELQLVLVGRESSVIADGRMSVLDPKCQWNKRVFR